MTSIIKCRLPAFISIENPEFQPLAVPDQRDDVRYRIHTRRYAIRSDDDIEEITFVLYLWVLGLVDTNGMNRIIRDYAEQPFAKLKYGDNIRTWLTEARWKLFFDFDLTKLKLATVRILLKQMNCPKQIGQLFRDYDLPEDCVDLFVYLVKSDEWWAKIIKRLADIEDVVTSPSRLIKECEFDISKHKIYKHAHWHANRKLRFIADYNNFSTDDLAHDLLTNAISYYYKVRPFVSRLHAINYAKSALRGRTQQLITYWTDPSRSRLTYYGDKYGFTQTVLSGSDPTILLSTVKSTSRATIDARYGIVAQAFA